MLIKGESPDYISASVAHVRLTLLSGTEYQLRLCSAGLQAAESIHHSSESHAVDCQRFLENCVRQKVWSDSDAV